MTNIQIGALALGVVVFAVGLIARFFEGKPERQYIVHGDNGCAEFGHDWRTIDPWGNWFRVEECRKCPAWRGLGYGYAPFLAFGCAGGVTADHPIEYWADHLTQKDAEDEVRMRGFGAVYRLASPSPSEPSSEPTCTHPSVCSECGDVIFHVASPAPKSEPSAQERTETDVFADRFPIYGNCNGRECGNLDAINKLQAEIDRLRASSQKSEGGEIERGSGT